MKKFTNLMRLTMVVVLSSVMVVAMAQSGKVKPKNLQSTTNKSNIEVQATPGSTEAVQKPVKSITTADVETNLPEVTYTPSNQLSGNFGGPSDATLWDQSELINYPGQGYGGADASAIQTTLGHSLYGWGWQQSASNSMADDFTVCGEEWELNTVTFYGYQTGSTTTSTYTGVFVRIWKGNPAAGGILVWGDLVTNRLASTTWTGIYRSIDTGLTGSTRPIMQIVADVSLCPVLTPGQYWVEATATGSLTSGPWMPPRTILNQAVTGDAIQNTAGTWVAALNGTSPNGIPFIVDGTATPVAGNDVGVVAITSPVDGYAGTPQNVTVSVINLGTATLTNVPVYFILDGGAPVGEQIPSVPGCTTTTYTFTATVNPAVGAHTIQVCTNLGGDINTANDCMTKPFNILGAVDCVWSIELWDTYGDGWNGAYMDVLVGGSLSLDNITLASGYGPATYTFGVYIGQTIDLNFHTAGSYPSECYYKVYDNTATLVYQNPTNPPPTNYYITAYCGSVACPAPTALTTTLITTNSAQANWTAGGTETLWNWEYGPAGYTLGVGYIGNGTATVTNFPMSGLSVGTTYDWYVQADCGGGVTSGWIKATFTTVCEVICPVGSATEAEACGSDTNGGCNMATPTFEAVSPGVLCGTTWASGGTRDTDWFELTLTAPGTITMNGIGEGPMIFGMIEQINPGCPGCGNITGYIAPYTTTVACQGGTITTGGLPAGTYYFFVGLTVYDLYPCNVDYVVEWIVNPYTPAPGEFCSLAIPITPGTHIAPQQPYWYSFVGTGEQAMVSSCIVGQTVDTYVYIYDDCCGAALAFNDDDPTCGAYGFASLVEFPTVAGTTYYIYWDDVYGVGGFTFNLFMGTPVSAITPASFEKEVPPGGTDTDVLNIGSTGTYPLVYSAVVDYGAAGGSVNVYPQNVAYYTGSVDNTTPPAVFSQNSLVRGVGEEAGWFKFDLSGAGIPSGATITSVVFNGYVNGCNWPYYSLTPLSGDPMSMTADVLYADITAEEGGAGDYIYVTESSTAAPGWRNLTLGGTILADIQTGLVNGYIAMGLAETDHFASYYVYFDGWNEANKPYLTINYVTGYVDWITLDGAQTDGGVVFPGGSDPINVGFNAAGMPVGTYTCNIVVTTNETTESVFTIPVTMHVGWVLYGNVYYGMLNTKPQVTTTSVTLAPGYTQNAGAGGTYRYRALADGSYSIIGASGKAWTGLNSPDPTLAQRYILGLQVLTTLQQRAADVNLTGTIQSIDVTMMKRRILGQTYTQWVKPTEMIWDGPFIPGWHGVSPSWIMTGAPVTISGANVNYDVRCMFTGDVNNSATPAPNP